MMLMPPSPRGVGMPSRTMIVLRSPGNSNSVQLVVDASHWSFRPNLCWRPRETTVSQNAVKKD